MLGQNSVAVGVTNLFVCGRLECGMRINEADAVRNKTARENAACQRLLAIPGIGPVSSTALIAAIGNGAAFRKGESLRPGWAWFRTVGIDGGYVRATASTGISR
jgi:transposase